MLFVHFLGTDAFVPISQVGCYAQPLGVVTVFHSRQGMCDFVKHHLSALVNRMQVRHVAA
jgi:hypothetical protein